MRDHRYIEFDLLPNVRFEIVCGGQLVYKDISKPTKPILRCSLTSGISISNTIKELVFIGLAPIENNLWTDLTYLIVQHCPRASTSTGQPIPSLCAPGNRTCRFCNQINN